VNKVKIETIMIRPGVVVYEYNEDFANVSGTWIYLYEQRLADKTYYFNREIEDA
jgi:hypothetical protein